MKSIQKMQLALGITAALLIGAAPLASARGVGGGGRQVRSQARTSVNRPAGNSGRTANVNRNDNVNRGTNGDRNVNRNVNTNRNYNANVNVNRNVDVDVHNHDDWDHPFATAAAVTAGVAVTAAVIGSVVTTIPTSCVVTVVNNVTYQQCGSTWYQPQYYGTSVRYVVVHAP